MSCDASNLDAVCVEELMIRYQQADAAAASALVDRLSSPLYRYFSRYSRTGPDAADMLQEMWLRIHRVRHTYRPGSPLLPWVYAIAHRGRIDNYRTLRRRKQEILVDVVPDSVSQAQVEAGIEVCELLSSLPEAQRSVLMLLKVDGLSIQEVAHATLSTTGAVKQKAHRAYERLRKMTAHLARGAARA